MAESHFRAQEVEALAGYVPSPSQVTVLELRSVAVRSLLRSPWQGGVVPCRHHCPAGLSDPMEVGTGARARVSRGPGGVASWDGLRARVHISQPAHWTGLTHAPLSQSGVYPLPVPPPTRTLTRLLLKRVLETESKSFVSSPMYR